MLIHSWRQAPNFTVIPPHSAWSCTVGSRLACRNWRMRNRRGLESLTDRWHGVGGTRCSQESLTLFSKQTNRRPINECCGKVTISCDMQVMQNAVVQLIQDFLYRFLFKSNSSGQSKCSRIATLPTDTYILLVANARQTPVLNSLK